MTATKNTIQVNQQDLSAFLVGLGKIGIEPVVRMDSADSNAELTFLTDYSHFRLPAPIGGYLPYYGAYQACEDYPGGHVCCDGKDTHEWPVDLNGDIVVRYDVEWGRVPVDELARMTEFRTAWLAAVKAVGRPGRAYEEKSAGLESGFDDPDAEAESESLLEYLRRLLDAPDLIIMAVEQSAVVSVHTGHDALILSWDGWGDEQGLSWEFGVDDDTKYGWSEDHSLLVLYDRAKEDSVTLSLYRGGKWP